MWSRMRSWTLGLGLGLCLSLLVFHPQVKSCGDDVIKTALVMLVFLRVIDFLPSRRYASAVFATATCLSVCLSHAGIVPIAERKQDREM